MKRFCFWVAIVFAIALPAAVADAYNYVDSCAPTWPADQLPLNYYINEIGTPDVPLQKVEAVLQKSFGTWGQPCGFCRALRRYRRDLMNLNCDVRIQSLRR